MRVGLDQARHDRGPGAVHHLVAGLDRGAAAGPYTLDTVAAHHHVGRRRRSAGPVEDLPVDKHDAIHPHSECPRRMARQRPFRSMAHAAIRAARCGNTGDVNVDVLVIGGGPAGASTAARGGTPAGPWLA